MRRLNLYSGRNWDQKRVIRPMPPPQPRRYRDRQPREEDMPPVVRSVLRNLGVLQDFRRGDIPLPEPEKFCTHQTLWRYMEQLELYCRPCLECRNYCNCINKDSKEYPDVVVRSGDKKLVLLSGNLVRSAWMLRQFVDRLQKVEEELPTEEVTVKMRDNQVYGVIEVLSASVKKPDVKLAKPKDEVAKWKGVTIRKARRVNARRRETSKGKDSPSVPDNAPENGPPDEKEKAGGLPPGFGIRDTAKKFHRYKEEVAEAQREIPWEEVVELPKKKVLALFDPDSDAVNFGAKADILMKVDYWVNAHLDEVEGRVRAKNRREVFLNKTRYTRSAYFNKYLEEEIDHRKTFNTFHYEDWEEECLSVDHLTFWAIHQCNQELLIVDLQFSIEKWVFLSRGFPQEMVNGDLELKGYTKPEKLELKPYGLYACDYPNKYITRYPKQICEAIPITRKGYERWWSIKEVKSLDAD